MHRLQQQQGAFRTNGIRVNKIHNLVDFDIEDFVLRYGHAKKRPISRQPSALHIQFVKKNKANALMSPPMTKDESDDDFDELLCAQIDMGREIGEKFWTLRVVKLLEDGSFVGQRLSDLAAVTVRVEGQFAAIKLQPGLLVNLLFTALNREPIVNDDQNALVLEPQRLLPVTLLADAFACRRKAVLAARFASPAEPDLEGIMAIGSIVHAVFEAHLQKVDFNLDALMADLPATLDKDSVRRRCLDLIALVPSFCRRRVLRKDHSVVDCERNIWSLALGIKGKIDLVMINGRSEEYPVELKTGKKTDSVAHRAQTLYYVLLLHFASEANLSLEERQAYLAFLRTDELVPVKVKWTELRQLIATRNRVIQHLLQPSSWLPAEEPCQNKFICQMCPFEGICWAPNPNEAFLTAWIKAIDEEEATLHKANLLLSPDASGSLKNGTLNCRSDLSAGDAIIAKLGNSYTTGTVASNSDGCLQLSLNSPFNGDAVLSVWRDELGGAFATWRWAMTAVAFEPRLQFLMTKRQGPVERFVDVQNEQSIIVDICLKSSTPVLIHGMPGTNGCLTFRL